MKDIILREKHISLGAKMVEFAGYYMPLQYTGLTDEHLNVRGKAGIFDVSHMGEFIVEGKGALDFLQMVSSNDVAKLLPGKIQYSCLPNDKGGIVDDLLVYQLGEEKYMLVVNASNIEKDWNWLQSHKPKEVKMENVSDTISLFAVQGPAATEMLQELTTIQLSEMQYYTFQTGVFAGKENVIVSATGYTGAGGFEIYVQNSDALAIFEKIMKAGEPKGLKPAGLAARDTLRLEMGFCLYGNDIDETTSPIEAGLGWITKFTKDFIKSDYHRQLKDEGPSRKLVGFELMERGIPRQGYLILDKNGSQVGSVTSGTMSPSLNKAIGLAYIQTDFITNSELFVEIRNKSIPINIVKLPFLKGK